MNQRPTADFYNFTLYDWTAASDWKEQSLETNRPVLILSPPAAPEALALLQKILSAIQWSTEQNCNLLQIETAVPYKDLLPTFPNLHTLLVFGWKPTELGLHLSLPLYQLAPFQNKQLLFADALETIAADQQQQKKRLWRQLQQLKS